MTKTIVSELICTRLNHDIIGNVGAVANAVELLEEGDLDFLDDIKSILKTASHVLSARLKFFRLAFGTNNSTLADIANIGKITADYINTVGSASHRIDLRFSYSDAIFAKPAMLCAMLLADLSIKGGTIEIVQNGDVLAAVFHADQKSLEKINTIKDIIAHKEAAADAQYAHAFYLLEILPQLGLTIKASVDNEIRITIAKE